MIYVHAIFDLSTNFFLLSSFEPCLSIWTTATMALYILNVDHGDLDRISYRGFSAKKRIVHSEEQVNKAIFRTSQAEANDNEGILASERLDMSSLVSGGAGTGKT